MPEQLTIPVDKGCVTGTDASLLEPGYLQEAIGVVYSPSDPAARKYPGRVLLNGTAIASKPSTGIEFIDFDNATDRIVNKVDTVLYSADPVAGSFSSIRTGLTSSAQIDGAMSSANQFFMCDGTDTNWVVKPDNTTFRHGLQQIIVAPTQSNAGTGITGTFVYWATEYDSTNFVEGAATSAATLTVTVTNKTITITKSATINASADKWRLYRTKDTGAYPIGWLVAEIAIGTTTYADSTSDAVLVGGAPYNVVTINGISESQDMPAPAFRSLAFYKGSLIGVTNRDLYYSESLAYHSFPTSYDLPLPPRFGGAARCVRRVGSVALVFFDHECFRINYLPKAADASFSTGDCWESIGNYGTISPKGACVFSGWGGQEMCIFASRGTIMLTDGNAFDQAVKNIDWAATVSVAQLASCVMLDDPDNLRVRMFYNSSDTDTTQWKELHFYYDANRIGTSSGFPELAWTGPHPSPGPGTLGVLSSVGTVYTASKKDDGFVYREGVGTSDAANLSSLGAGIIEFSLKIPRIYPKGIGGQATCERVFINKGAAGSGSYTCTMSAGNEEDQVRDYSRAVSAVASGASSNDFHASGQSFSFQITKNDTLPLPKINNIALTFDDLSEEWAKTVRR